MATDSMPTTLADRLRALAAARNLKPYQLADRAGVARSTLSRLWNGKQRSMQIDTAMRLAQVLDCDPSDLVSSAPIPDAIPIRQRGGQDDSYEVVDMGTLVLDYIASEWYAQDAPTPDEMQWLASQTGLLYPASGPAPSAATAHKLVLLRRAGKL